MDRRFQDDPADYAGAGVAAPAPAPQRYRVYSEGDVTLVERNRALISVGLIATCSEMVGELSGAHDKMSSAVKDLRTSRAPLNAIIEAAPHDESAEPVTV